MDPNERHVVLHNGEPVLLRRLMPEDAALYPDFLAAVTPEDLRLRLLIPAHEVSQEMLDKLIHYDPARAMAFIAVDQQTGQLLGVVRLHDEPGGTSAEFAILVRSKLKGRGLGWIMMQHMIAYARKKGLKTMRGQVLAENKTMLKMCNQLGFRIANDPAERGVKVVTLTLDNVAGSSPASS
ncbi:MAG TPA: GNAT family N-acetyltransferase [Pseudolabrys sp.]|jgi:acetyltransferase|nr:GNAT family N-acetyltransferase [Pseudolabrys sp.]